MSIEWLVVWGVTQAVGFTFKPILEELAKDATKDWVKDIFKGCLSNVIKLPQKEPLEIAAGKALKEFLALFEQELEDAEIDDEEIKKYIHPLKKYLKLKLVQEILGSAFNQDIRNIDYTQLNQAWQEYQYPYQIPTLPDEFDWNRLGKRYCKKVKAIIQENDELRNLLNTNLLAEIADNTQNDIKPDFNLIKYQETLRERYGNLPLNGLDASIIDRRIRLWGIFISQKVRECQEYLPKVYEIPKEYQRRLQERGQLERELTLEELERLQKIYSSQPIRSVLEVIEDRNYQYFVILGDPGAGKTTLLKYLTIKWTELPLKELTVKPIPLLIELRDYIRSREEKECTTFLEFIHKSSGWVGHLNQHDLDEILKRGNALVMFDGLDEIFDPQQRETVINQIHNLTQDYPKIKVIATSRVIGYQPSRLRDAKFHHFMIQDLEDKQIAEFIEKWHTVTCDTEREKQRDSERLKQAINNSSAIQELAGNPLLLTMMAILNRSQELPRDRAELYNQCSRILLYQWDIGRALIEDKRIDPKLIDYKDKQAMCRQIAYFMQSNEKGLAGNLISGDDLERILREYLKTIEITNPRDMAKLIIHQLRHRNFILCLLGADYYAFVHRTFLEYFCASEFVWRFKESQTLALEELKTKVFGNHWQDKTWHEVLKLIAGLIEPKFVEEMIEYLMSQEGEANEFMNLFLAADCLNEVRNRKEIQAIGDRLLEEIKALVHYSNAQEASDRYDDNKMNLIGNILSNSMKAIAIVWEDSNYLKICAQSDEDEDVRSLAIQQLAQQFREDPDTLEILKTLAQSDENEFVRRTAIQQLAQQFREDPDTLEILKTLAQSDENEFVRRTAIQQLAQQFREDPDILEILKTYAQSDEDGFVRSTAIKQLAQQFREVPDTLEILKTHAQSDEDGFVRRTVIQQLAQQFREDPDTLEILKTRAQSDGNEYVRSIAIQQLAQQFREGPDTLKILKILAQSDKNEYVRSTAIQQLAQQFREDPDTLEILKTLVQSDKNEFVRRRAIEQLAQQFRENLNTLEILKTYAQLNEDGSVRSTAIEQLAQQFKEDPNTLEILKTYAQSAEYGSVRMTAIEQLAQHFREDPTLFEFLSQCAVNDPFQRKENWQTNPRQTAVECLVKLFPNHPQLAPLLKDRLNNDSDEKVKEYIRDVSNISF